MSGWTLFWVLLFIFAVIVGNLLWIKRTANMKFHKKPLPPGVKPQPYKDDDE